MSEGGGIKSLLDRAKEKTSTADHDMGQTGPVLNRGGGVGFI